MVEHPDAASPRHPMRVEREVHLFDAVSLRGFANSRLRAWCAAAEQNGIRCLHGSQYRGSRCRLEWLRRRRPPRSPTGVDDKTGQKVPYSDAIAVILRASSIDV